MEHAGSNVLICFQYTFTLPSFGTVQEVKDCKPTSVPFQHLPVNMERSGNADYLRFTRPLSPWTCLEGWHLGCCFHDPMHVLFLGTCRDLYGSALAYWLRNDCYGEGSMAAKLRQFSYDLKTQSRAAGFLGVCFNQMLLICFDPSSSNRLDWCGYIFLVEFIYHWEIFVHDWNQENI